MIINYALQILISLFLLALFIGLIKDKFSFITVLQDHDKHPSSMRFFSLLIVMLFIYAGFMMFSNLQLLSELSPDILKIISGIFFIIGIMGMFPKLLQKMIEKIIKKKLS